jgi:glycosyltransferase involved in cell wall biosynthesis
VRIAIVTEVWGSTVNGVVTRLSATVNELLAQGHELLVVCPANSEPIRCPRPFGRLVVRTVPAIGVPFIYGGQRWGLPTPRVRRYLADFGPELVHVVNPVSLGMAGIRAAQRLRIPLVCSYHTDIVAYAGHYHLGWLRPIIRAHLRRLHGRATLNLVTSAAAAHQLRELGVVARPDGRGAVMKWQRGVALDQFRPPAAAFHPSAGRRTGPHRALYVGRLADEKHVGDLAALAADPNFELTVVGDGPARRTLADRLPETTVFTGTLRGAELAAAYRAADLFVFPSVTDTLGLVLLEALASGLPVLAADSPASRELLGSTPAARLWTDGQTDVLPQLALELLGSACRSQLAGWARAEVDGRTWSAATAQLLGYYRHAQALATGEKSALAIRPDPQPRRLVAENRSRLRGRRTRRQAAER